jgi:predicted ATPase/class 3 adenylate cyclase
MNGLPGGAVTFLFTDIEGSTRLVKALRERYPQVLADHRRLIRAAVAAHSGHEVDTQGDAFFVAFAGAKQAVLCALAVQRALAAHGWPAEGRVRVRIGVHTGHAVPSGGMYTGLAVHRAARICAAACGGQVLVSQATQSIIEDEEEADPGFTLMDLGEQKLKDLDRPVRLFQLAAPGLEVPAGPAAAPRAEAHRAEGQRASVAFPGPGPSDARPGSPGGEPDRAWRRGGMLPAQLTGFVGRERELGEVAGLLERDRLVTLAGPGGCGKTRLAVVVADRLLPQFDDGVFFVPLAPVRDPQMVPSTIAGVLGVREGPGLPAVAALEEQLRGRRSLLVLDNFEHLLPAASVVSRLLAAAPQVKALVTSRVLLRIYGEREYVVAPLPIPEPQETTVAEVESYPAVQLFVDRAGMARSGFGLSAGSVTAVAEICRRLDGLPLAIELAAARIRVLSSGELLGRLGRRLALEGAARGLPERQRTLRATIDWSHQLLDVEEARLFAQLSVFAGGWTRQAAERVCGEGLRVQVLDGLESLVEHSLVQRVTLGGDELRFDMLETIREYARERLDASGAAADLARRHGRYFLELAEDAEPHLTGPQAGRWLEVLRVETDNLRSALRWAIDRGDPPSVEIGLRMAASLWRFWQQTGALREARQWLEGLLARGTDPGIRSARARALIAAGSIAYWQADLGRARQLYQLAVEQSRTLGDRRGMADALSNLAPVPMMTGDLPRARRLAAQARDLWQELGDDWQAALATMTLGMCFLLEGGYEQALAYFEEFMPIVRARGDRFWLIGGLTSTAQAQHFLGHFEPARKNFGEALRLALEANDLASVTVALGPLSNLEGADGDHDRAVRLWAACEAIKQRIGGGAPAEVMRVSDPCAAATLAIGEDAVRCSWAEGSAMNPEQAVRYATREPAASRTRIEP